MAEWDYTVEKVTPELARKFGQRQPREATRRIQEALADLKSPEEVVALRLPEGAAPNPTKTKIKGAAKGVGLYVQVAIEDSTAYIRLAEPPPPDAPKRGGRPKKQAES